MAWLCSSPLTNLWQAGLMPEWLADRPCLNHCHKRHIVYRTERHCNTNTNTPRVGNTLGKPLVCGSSVGLKANIAMKVLLQLLIKVCVILLPFNTEIAQYRHNEVPSVRLLCLFTLKQNSSITAPHCYF